MMFQWIKELLQGKQKDQNQEQIKQEDDKNNDQTSLIYAALQKLGSTKEEVFNYLLAHNHKGGRMQPTSCPVANYLKSSGIDVGFGIVGTRGAVKVVGQHFLVDGVGEFIIGFDNSKYPELEWK